MRQPTFSTMTKDCQLKQSKALSVWKTENKGFSKSFLSRFDLRDPPKACSESTVSNPMKSTTKTLLPVVLGAGFTTAGSTTFDLLDRKKALFIEGGFLQCTYRFLAIRAQIEYWL